MKAEVGQKPVATYPGSLDEAVGDTVEERVAEVQHPVLLLKAAADLVHERPRFAFHAARLPFASLLC
jgi:hypothetical protein